MKNPIHFNFFIQLHYFKMNLDQMKLVNKKVSKLKVEKYLSDLEKIETIQIIDGKIHSLLADGFQISEKFNVRYRANYEIALKKLKGCESKRWEAWMYEGFGTFTLSHKSALELRNQIQTVFEEFSRRSQREKNIYSRKELVNTGTLFLNIPMKIQEVFPII